MSNYKWNIPFSVLFAFPNLPQFINHIIIPKPQLQDDLIWKGAPSHSLTFKEAFTFKSPISQKLQWAKTIWSPHIPPSKSFLAWRIMQDWMPTDEKLMSRGCSMASVCSNCFKEAESTMHVFFNCPYVVGLACFHPQRQSALQFNR